MHHKKKLIEVALPLEAINAASAREKSIRHGHPSTLHLWWARRPLAAARAVIFAQMVDDPSAHPDLFPTEKEQEKERQRLFRIIEDLVLWENTTNEKVLRARARRDLAELAADLRRERRPSARQGAVRPPQAARLPRPLRRRRRAAAGGAAAGAGELRQRPEPGGGADQQGDDRDPAEVRGQAAGEPRGARGQDAVRAASGRARRGWPRTCATTASGCATRPRSASATSTRRSRSRPEMAKERPDLKPYVGQKLTVIAWLWARTVKSPNPAFAQVDVPLASTFMLSTKAGQGGVRRAGDRGRRLPLHGEGRASRRMRRRRRTARSWRAGRTSRA